MPLIPNTLRRGAIYHYRRARRLPSGKPFRVIVTLRTACPKAARFRAAVLNARFEGLCMRLFAQQELEFAMAPADAKRLFQTELANALTRLESERETAITLHGEYDFANFETFMMVHEEVYRFLAEYDLNYELSREQWVRRVGHLGDAVADLGYQMLSNKKALYHIQLEQTSAALEAEDLDTDVNNMGHGARLVYEARIAAIREYRRTLADPALRYADAGVPLRPLASATTASSAPAPAAPSIPEPYGTLTAVQAAEQFILDNPRLLGSESGKRKAAWTDKTRGQFDAVMRLLGKSIGDKPFWQLTNTDLSNLLKQFDGLPSNHHKPARHKDMTLDAICAEAKTEVAAGRMSKDAIGLSVTTLNRHFRFLHTAHDWIRKAVPQANEIDWSPFTFDDSRTAREQRMAFPVDLGRKIFTLPPWRGCQSAARRFKPGREVVHDALYWVFPVLWYTGARREEACKLMVADVRQDEGGIWYFDITDTESGRVKNEGSKRKVPMADELIRLGFLDFVAAMKARGETLLFPELITPSVKMGDHYYARLWVKLAKLIDLPDGITLHGIRHMVASELKDAGVEQEVRADLLGHVSESETAGRYSKASRLKTMLDVVNKIPVVTATVRREAILLGHRRQNLAS